MKYPITVQSCIDPYEHYRYDVQNVFDSDGRNIFCVYDLNDSPEDAILGRRLFDAGDFINAIKLGMRIAKAGYEDLEISYEEYGKTN